MASCSSEIRATRDASAVEYYVWRKGLYADAGAEVDWSVGRILDKVRELGVAENTLVLFTSDNGGGHFPGMKVRNASNAPFSGGKATPAEGGFRVPTIAWWPGTIAAGSHSA